MEGRTLMNTTLEKALPGFLLLTDLASQIRIGRIINRGGNGILFEGFIVDPVLRSRAQEDVVAVKKIECKPAFLSSSSLQEHDPRQTICCRQPRSRARAGDAGFPPRDHCPVVPLLPPQRHHPACL